jgi:hypothetical protein
MSENVGDRRRGKRVAFTIRAPVASESGGGGLIDNSWTIDISGSGVRLRLRGQIVPGQIVDVYLNKRPEQCRVVWTRPGGVPNELIAGLEFIHPVPGP